MCRSHPAHLLLLAQLVTSWTSPLNVLFMENHQAFSFSSLSVLNDSMLIDKIHQTKVQRTDLTS
ncbi:uncharacterized protein PHALS_04386 [Plasmopara halstedii]|uniref:RxLR-like protein n=1 Tax=Plasmopara halstedii TaxID=4781 RepID=A0A0P1B0M8_PLAHL|nr:uncharacterized protein PHALS_04386 [Plasmopara halstedii]CEG47518.1 hypothetical protein PHALS_04386 [Plasmopara halstedii]|eukprot:XP_024583887.1 hypothetical protein PHALS_04386 [Plasmopara halstedii]